MKPLALKLYCSKINLNIFLFPKYKSYIRYFSIKIIIKEEAEELFAKNGYISPKYLEHETRYSKNFFTHTKDALLRTIYHLYIEQGSGSMSEKNQLGEQIRFCPKSVVVESRIREWGITKKNTNLISVYMSGFSYHYFSFVHLSAWAFKYTYVPLSVYLISYEN